MLLTKKELYIISEGQRQIEKQKNLLKPKVLVLSLSQNMKVNYNLFKQVLSMESNLKGKYSISLCFQGLLINTKKEFFITVKESKEQKLMKFQIWKVKYLLIHRIKIIEIIILMTLSLNILFLKQQLKFKLLSELKDHKYLNKQKFKVLNSVTL